MAIQVLRLISGEEIVGDVKREAGDYVVKRPIQFALVPATGGQVGVSFAPFAAFNKLESIILPERSVLFSFEPVDEFKNEYNSKFGSGLVMASPSDAARLSLKV